MLFAFFAFFGSFFLVALADQLARRRIQECREAADWPDFDFPSDDSIADSASGTAKVAGTYTYTYIAASILLLPLLL